MARMAMEMTVIERMAMAAMPVIATAMAMPLMATMHANGNNNKE